MGVKDVVECRSSRVPKKCAKPYKGEVVDYFRWTIASYLTCSEDVSTVNVSACVKEVESIRSTLRSCTFFHDAMEELRSVFVASALVPHRDLLSS